MREPNIDKIHFKMNYMLKVILLGLMQYLAKIKLQMKNNYLITAHIDLSIVLRQQTLKVNLKMKNIVVSNLTHNY